MKWVAMHPQGIRCDTRLFVRYVLMYRMMLSVVVGTTLKDHAVLQLLTRL